MRSQSAVDFTSSLNHSDIREVTEDLEPGEKTSFQECILIWPLLSRHIAHLDEI